MIIAHAECAWREHSFLSKRKEVCFCEVAIVNSYRNECPASLIEVRWLLFIDADEIVKNSGGNTLYSIELINRILIQLGYYS
jgi:hypothetical protein